MSLNIHNNMGARIASYYLQKNYNNMGKSIEHLSSGLRINNAGDDPQGKALSEMLKSRASVLDKGMTNVQMAISVSQTAEGSLGVIDEKLIRMKELAEQSATGTYNNTQRIMLNSEFNEMAAEIDRIAKSTNLSGLKLLDGNISTSTKYTTNNGWFRADSNSYTTGNSKKVYAHFTKDEKLKVHFGQTNSSAEDYYYIHLKDMTTNGLFHDFIDTTDSSKNSVSKVVSISSIASAQRALAQINSAMVYKEEQRSHLGAIQNRLETSLNHLEITKEQVERTDSILEDVDVATEMSNFTKFQVLTQSATSMLAQANALPQMVLKLLS